jgi:flagellar motor component MotA
MVLVALLAIVSIVYFFFVGFVIWGSDYSEIIKMSSSLVFTIAAVFLLAYSCMIKTVNVKHLAAGALFLSLSQVFGLPLYSLMARSGEPMDSVLWIAPAFMFFIGIIYLMVFFEEELK